MQHLRNLGAVAMLGIVVAACGGGSPTNAPAATQAGNGGNGGNGGTPTEQPAATDGGNGGNGGTVGFQNGKVTFTVTGAITGQGELGFVPTGSMFGGSEGSVLNFADSTDGGQGSVLSIANSSDGSVTVSYTSTALGQVPGTTCTTTDWNIGATSASGKFDCTSQLSISISGAVVGPSTIKGEFTAHS